MPSTGAMISGWAAAVAGCAADFVPFFCPAFCERFAAARAVAADVDELYAFVNLLNLNTRIWTKR